MDRGWYTRFLLVAVLAVSAAVTVWSALTNKSEGGKQHVEWLPPPPPLFTTDAKLAPGLDISGGLRLMYEVEVDEAIRDRRDLRADQLLRRLGVGFGLIEEDATPTREQLAQARERVTIKKVGERQIRLTFKTAADAAKLNRELITYYGDLSEASTGELETVLEVEASFLERIRDTAVQQARETIADRIDALGLAQAAVTAQNTEIIVEVPGADDAEFDRIREIISKTAHLEFKIVDDESTFVRDLEGLPEGITRQSEQATAGEGRSTVSTYLVARGEGARQRLGDYVQGLIDEGKVPDDHSLLLSELEVAPEADAAGPSATEQGYRTYYLHGRAQVTGQDIEDSFVANDPQDGRPIVSVTFNDLGAGKFRQLTGANIKRRMAIVLDEIVKSAPVIQAEIGKQCTITLGGFRDYNLILNEANDLVIVLKAGSLPVPIRPANEQMIGPSLGRDGIEKGAMGGLIGVALVLIFMLMYYQVAGLVADVMVLLNLLFLLAGLSILGATITLPGVAAIALNIGMAVDANVLITERIREELRSGKSTRAAVDQGFARAFWSIIDSQFTTFLAGVVLFQYGTGPIKGFAVTLMIGICTSLFTGVFCSRVAFDWIARGLRVQRLRVG